MESRWGSDADAAAARVALDDVDRARRHVADRSRAPWWYHLGLGLSTAILFASLGASTVGVVVGGILGPMGLTWMVKRSTGVGVDRYRWWSSGSPGRQLPAGAGGWFWPYMVLFLLAAGVPLAVHVAWGITWAAPVAGAVMFLPTVLLSNRLDRAYRRELRSGR